MADVIRVLHVYKTYSPETFGGVEAVIQGICESLDAKRITSTIYCATRGSSRIEIVNGIEVNRFNAFASLSSNEFVGLKGIIEFYRLARKHDVIHFHYPWPTGELLSLLLPRNKKRIVTYHSDVVKSYFLRLIYSPLQKIFLSQVTRIIATSPQYAASSKVLNVNKIRDKVGVIPIGLTDIDTQIDFDTPAKICFIGVFRPYKGLSVLLEAAKFVKGTVVLAGDGPEYETVSRKVSQDQMQNVELLGKITEEMKLALLNSSSMLVLPSVLRSEAFGVVLLEASRAGLPMVTTELHTGTSFVNLHQKTGLVVPPNDAIALAEAINKLLADRDLRVSYGRAARERFEQNFNINCIAESYAEEYEALYEQYE